MKKAIIFLLLIASTAGAGIALHVLTGMDFIVYDERQFPFQWRTYYSLYQETKIKIENRNKTADVEICHNGLLHFCKGNTCVNMAQTGFSIIWPRVEIYGNPYFGRVRYDDSGNNPQILQQRSINIPCEGGR